MKYFLTIIALFAIASVLTNPLIAAIIMIAANVIVGLLLTWAANQPKL